MAKAYRFFVPSGYFAGEVEDHGLQPSNSTYEVPKHIKGFVPRWTGKEWEQVENHKGKTGYLNGEPYIIKEFGPLPDSWDKNAPEPTNEQLMEVRINEIDAAIIVLEQKTIRPTLAIEYGIDESFDHERRKELVTQIIDLRCEKQRLEMLLDPDSF